MKLKINWNDMKCIIDDVEYKLSREPYFNDYYGFNILLYINDFNHSTFYRKDDLILEYSGRYYLIKLDENDKIINEWMLNEMHI